MTGACRKLFPAGLALAAACLAGAPASPEPITSTPAKNWTLQLFTDEGYHSMTLRGSQVRPVNSDRIDVVGINITTFSGDASASVESSLLSSQATFHPKENSAGGDQSVRFIRFNPGGDIVAEVTGEDWTYQQEGKKVSIRRNAHVVFMEQLSDVLK